MTRILLVEDDPKLRTIVANNLTYEGFSVSLAEDGEQALTIHRSKPTDLIVLDLMLPLLDGFQVLGALRGAGDLVPVLLLTARGAEADRVRGLREGADDYLVKPFSVVELVARIRAILRRSATATGPALKSGPFLVHRNRRQVYFDGKSLGLTSLEFQMLEALVSHAGTPLSREELIAILWGPAEPSGQKKLNVHMTNLRRKLADAGPAEWVVTVGRPGRGGYLWAPAVEAAPDC